MCLVNKVAKVVFALGIVIGIIGLSSGIVFAVLFGNILSLIWFTLAGIGGFGLFLVLANILDYLNTIYIRVHLFANDFSDYTDHYTHHSTRRKYWY